MGFISLLFLLLLLAIYYYSLLRIQWDESNRTILSDASHRNGGGMQQSKMQSMQSMQLKPRKIKGYICSGNVIRRRSRNG